MLSRRLPRRIPSVLGLLAAALLAACGDGGGGNTLPDGGQTCTRSRDCPSGMGCVNSVCVAQPCGGCQPDEVCADTGSCVAAQGAACPSTGCPTGYKCTGSFCAKPCTLDSQCDRGSVCNSSLGTCAQCTFDAQCAGVSGKPRCDSTSGRCVACTQPNDCARGNFCEVSTHTCKPGCLSNTDCNAAGGERCDGATSTTPGRCIQCSSDNECKNADGSPSAAPACDSTGHCVQCTADKYCPLGTPRCDTASHLCVQCLPANNATGTDCGCFVGGTASACPAGSTTGDSHTALTCNADSHQCTPGCQFDTQCGCPRTAQGAEQNCIRAPHTTCCKNEDCNTAAGDTCVGASASCTYGGAGAGSCQNGGKVVVSAAEYCDPLRRKDNQGKDSLGACGECAQDAHCRYRITGATGAANYNGQFATMNGSRCVNARCVEGCNADSDCPASKICHLGQPGDPLNNRCVQCSCDGATTQDGGNWCLDSAHCANDAGGPRVCDAKTLNCRHKRFGELCDASNECGDTLDPTVGACIPVPALCVKEFLRDAQGLGSYEQCSGAPIGQGKCGIPCNDFTQNTCTTGTFCPGTSICRSAKDLAGGTGKYCVPGGCR